MTAPPIIWGAANADGIASGSVSCSESALDVLWSNNVGGAQARTKNNITVDIDGIASFLEKYCAACLVIPLKRMFISILKQTIFHSLEIFKNNIHFQIMHCIQNYRPVATISGFDKLFETVLCNKIFALVSRTQYSFIRGQPTPTNLCNFTQLVCKAMDGRRKVSYMRTSTKYLITFFCLIIKTLDCRLTWCCCMVITWVIVTNEISGI